MILVEKYRPTSLDEIVISDDLKNLLVSSIEKNTIPTITLYGMTGTGKSSIVNIIKHQFDVEYMFINASEERGIDTVREKIIPFCDSVSLQDHKMIDFREADALSYHAQRALLDVIEENSHIAFILSTNNLNKLHPAIKGRCKPFKVQPDSKAKVANHILNIIRKENITTTTDDIKGLVKKYFPDIRSMIQDLDKRTFNGKFTLSDDRIDLDIYDNILKEISTSKNLKDVIVRYKKVRSMVNTLSDNEIDSIYSFLFDNVESFSSNDLEYIYFNLKISEFMNTNYNMGVDKQINLSALLLTILNFRYSDD